MRISHLARLALFTALFVAPLAQATLNADGLTGRNSLDPAPVADSTVAVQAPHQMNLARIQQVPEPAQPPPGQSPDGNEISALNREVAYWKARALSAEERIETLEKVNQELREEIERLKKETHP